MSRFTGFVLILLALCLVLPALAAETQTVNGKEYMKVDNKWYFIDHNDQLFEVEDVITVKFKSHVQESAQTTLHQQVGGSFLRANRLGFIDIKVPAGSSVFDAVAEYQKSNLIELAELNTIGYYVITPNDNLYNVSWHLEQGNDADMDVSAAWDLQTGSSTVVVGVLDSGTDWDHEDMGTGPDAYENIWLNNGEDAWADPNNPNSGNGVDDDNNGYVDDWKAYDFSNNNNDARGPFYHGTMVASIVAAKTNNALGVSGIAGGWNSQGSLIMTCGVGDFSPNSSILDDAILYAAENGAQIITLSLTVGQSGAIDAALSDAYNTYGAFIDCASGNFASQVSYPATHVDVMAIGATDTGDQLAGFSNRGADQEVSAPGVNVWGADLNDGYLTSSGTSFSAPCVAGVAALMLSENPALTNDDIRQLLKDTADKVGGYDYNWNAGMPGHSFELGYGRVNAFAAVEAAGDDDPLIDCADVRDLRARCQPGNTLQSMLRFWNNDYDGTSVTFVVNGSDTYVRPVVNDRARLSLAGYGAGLHSIEVTEVSHCVGPVDANCTGLAAEGSDWMAENEATLPVTTELLENYPNPFNPSTSIRYNLNEDAVLSIKIYNSLGQEVATLVNGFQEAGFHQVEWNGRDNFGTPVSSGIYLYRMEADGFAETRKMLLTK